MRRLFEIGVVLALSAGVAAAAEREPLPGGRAPEAPTDAAAAAPKQTVCELIEQSAKIHAIPVGFLTRLIWRESSFRLNAISPKGAQGIAQFMPGTANLRRLADPFDPAAAIPASAHYLSDLATRFGNLGLAAAAYNAGEKRVGDWLAGAGRLPGETRDYVFAITGRAADEWALPDAEELEAARETCVELAAILARPGAGTDVVEPVVQGEWAPWGVQVAGNFSLARATASYGSLQRRFSGVLSGKAPLVVRSFNRSRGRAAFFNIRVPAETRDAATALCGKLRAAGGACLVIRN